MKRKKIKFGNLIFIIITICILLSLLKQKLVMKRLKSQSIELNEEIHALETDIKLLKEEIANSGSIEFIEKVAREDLGMVKPEEIIYIDKNRDKDGN